MILKETLKKHFINFNGGQGLDHWSPSSSQNFTRLVCNYSLPQKLRRTFKIRYKAPFGNLVNNTAQRLSCDILYKGERKITLENKNYDEELKKIEHISLPIYSKKNSPAYHLYLINIKNFNHKKKDIFIEYMKSKNIILQYHYIPIYKFKIFNDKYIGTNTEKYFKETISLPIFYGLKNNEQNYIINLIRLFFNKKSNIKTS